MGKLRHTKQNLTDNERQNAEATDRYHPPIELAEKTKLRELLTPLETAAAITGSVKRFEKLGLDRTTAIRTVACDNGLAPIQVVGAIVLYNSAISAEEAK